MSLGLDNPGLLPLSALIVVPLIVHLIARPRPRKLKFPSLMLLEKAHRESVRLRRPKHWLLLILRTLWVALIVAVFLMPRWFAQAQENRSATASRNVVIVIDATASMRAREGTQSRYTEAVTEAITLLQQLHSTDRANLIRVRAVPESIFAEPGVNHAFLQSELHKRACSREGGSLQDAVRLAVDQLAGSEQNPEIVVISDFQPEAQETPVLLTVPPQIALTTLNIAKEDLPNQAVTQVRLLPARPVSGQPFQVQVTVHNFSNDAVSRSLALRVGDRNEQQHLALPAGQSTVAIFPMQIEGEGELPLQATLEPDAFPADDQAYLVVPLKPILRIGIWGTDSNAAMWVRSLQAFAGISMVNLRSLEILPADLDALMLSGWRGEALPTIRQFVDDGGSLLFRPLEISPEASEWLNLPAGSLALSKMDPPMGVRIPDPWPETLNLFKDGSYGSPAKALLYQHAFFPVQDDQIQPILSLENGETVWGKVLAQPGVFYWNLSLAPEDSDLVTLAEWIPMFGEGLRHFFRASEKLEAEAGTQLPLSLPQTTGIPELRNENKILFETRSANQVIQSRDPLEPGLYEWRMPDGESALALRAVNLPAIESDLSSLAPETAEGKALPQLSHADAWQINREGRPLWPWLLALAFLIAAVEHVLTHRERRA